MILIRRFGWHVLFGAFVGVASCELWRYLLPGTASLWLIGAVTVVFVVAADLVVTGVRNGRARPGPSRRRAHARPNTRKAA